MADRLRSLKEFNTPTKDLTEPPAETVKEAIAAEEAELGRAESKLSFEGG